MATNWSERTKPTTNWSERTKPTTNWNERKKPEIYIAPLQDAYRIVHNEDDQIIYIISNE
jgi:hypothetical protein